MPFDAAGTRFIQFPHFDAGSVNLGHLRFGAEHDDQVHDFHRVLGQELGTFGSDVDALCEQDLGREVIDFCTGLCSRGEDSDAVIDQGAHESGRHLGLATVLDANEQHRGLHRSAHFLITKLEASDSSAPGITEK